MDGMDAQIGLARQVVVERAPELSNARPSDEAAQDLAVSTRCGPADAPASSTACHDLHPDCPAALSRGSRKVLGGEHAFPRTTGRTLPGSGTTWHRTEGKKKLHARSHAMATTTVEPPRPGDWNSGSCQPSALGGSTKLEHPHALAFGRRDGSAQCSTSLMHRGMAYEKPCSDGRDAVTTHAGTLGGRATRSARVGDGGTLPSINDRRSWTRPSQRAHHCKD